jgi:hypothetical protein
MYAIGAFDRFNYGDLLFPIISKNFIETHYPTVDFECYALVKSDFSRFGGLKTKPISQLYTAHGVNDGDIIYFCGGGTLGSDWISMHSNLLSNYGNLLLYYTKRIIGYKLANNFSRFWFGSNSEFPWIASPDNFSANVKVIYNSVGGSELENIPEYFKNIALKKLSSASYFSVRDAETKRICDDTELTIDARLAPDSAVLMSEQFPINFLESMIDDRLRNILSKGKYVCFHSNYGYAKNNFKEISIELEKIYYDQGFRAVLLPIGRYIGLDDYKGLLELKKHIKTPVEIIDNDITIWEIMYTIAAASLFIGTSLHGNVTAQSFAIPHIGLSGRKSKLDFYLETWDIPEQAVCPIITKLHRVAATALEIPELTRLEKKRDLISLATDNFHNIMKVVLN